MLGLKFGVYSLAFGVQRSAFSVRRSAFSVHWHRSFDKVAVGQNLVDAAAGS